MRKATIWFALILLNGCASAAAYRLLDFVESAND